ncbi:MAG TPA: polysaccharide biosynthesis/export family protein [Nevskia sp.]|nr:polysaccharide biosynthesis/export family protein [Nevskia sp.]
MPYIRLLLAGLTLASLCSCAEPVQQRDPRTPVTRSANAAAALDAAVYRLAAGDSVQVSVYGEPDLSVRVLIDPAGKINYPFLGQVVAAGRTAPQLAAVIAAGLRNGYLVNPDVRVSVAEYRPIYISGQVRRPASYPFTLGLTLQQALALAGGMTDYASPGNIFVQHENAPKTARVRLSMDSQLLPGDTIIVEERTF